MFDDAVREMRSLGKLLMPYSFPLKSPQDEEDISWLKQRTITVDGYDIVVYYNTCQYKHLGLESVQVFGRYFVFLPMAVVCKVGSRFLGDEELSLVEVMHEGDSPRKIYVWTVYYGSGKPVPNPFAKGVKGTSFDGLDFKRVDHKKLKFF